MKLKIISVSQPTFKKQKIFAYDSSGTTRFVLLIGSFTFKFAKIHPINAIKEIKVWWKLKLPFSILKTSAKGWSAGVIANMNETNLWKKTNHPLLIPTIFSFWGLLNIQVRGVNIEDNNPWFIKNHLVKSAHTDNFGDNHTLFNNKNWLIYKNSIKLADYGSCFIESNLSKYGDIWMKELAKTS